MNIQEVSKVIADKLQQAQQLVSECEDLADEHNYSFSLAIGGYGMGGYYEPDPKDGTPEENSYGEPNFGWKASSQSC